MTNSLDPFAVKYCINPSCTDKYYTLYIERVIYSGEFRWVIRNEYGHHLELSDFKLESLSSSEFTPKYVYASAEAAISSLRRNYKQEYEHLFLIDSSLLKNILIS